MYQVVCVQENRIPPKARTAGMDRIEKTVCMVSVCFKIIPFHSTLAPFHGFVNWGKILPWLENPGDVFRAFRRAVLRGNDRSLLGNGNTQLGAETDKPFRIFHEKIASAAKGLRRRRVFGYGSSTGMQ